MMPRLIHRSGEPVQHLFSARARETLIFCPGSRLAESFLVPSDDEYTY